MLIYEPKEEDLLSDLKAGEEVVYVCDCNKPSSRHLAFYARPEKRWWKYLLLKNEVVEKSNPF